MVIIEITEMVNAEIQPFPQSALIHNFTLINFSFINSMSTSIAPSSRKASAQHFGMCPLLWAVPQEAPGVGSAPLSAPGPLAPPSSRGPRGTREPFALWGPLWLRDLCKAVQVSEDSTGPPAPGTQEAGPEPSVAHPCAQLYTHLPPTTPGPGTLLSPGTSHQTPPVPQIFSVPPPQATPQKALWHLPRPPCSCDSGGLTWSPGEQREERENSVRGESTAGGYF